MVTLSSPSTPRSLSTEGSCWQKQAARSPRHLSTQHWPAVEVHVPLLTSLIFRSRPQERTTLEVPTSSQKRGWAPPGSAKRGDAEQPSAAACPLCRGARSVGIAGKIQQLPQWTSQRPGSQWESWCIFFLWIVVLYTLLDQFWSFLRIQLVPTWSALRREPGSYLRGGALRLRRVSEEVMEKTLATRSPLPWFHSWTSEEY